ncbi:pectin acetylesterase-family hydrolase [Jiangella alkaliphila]|uniref:Pectinacetylesterase n=1 Tax=Jiangella alkaliphila TaxID=419479 RepID=A0A1H2JQG2_9ACTN|nr:pectin acetylesterase-family hydrolase [Jiangella alkaliphila]SDU58660.1 Pectinacetylesterase [Jiangella alkaliphila]
MDEKPPDPSHDDEPKRWAPPFSGRVAAAIAVVLALLLAGGAYVLTGGNDSAADGSDPLAFAQCMRDNGIADFPEPNADGIALPESIDMDSPKFQAAEKACEDLMPVPDHTEANESDASDSASAWEKVVPGGDCECADGSEYSFYAREASTEKVVLFLDGGGGCWSAATCAPDGTNDYQTTVETPSGSGVLDFADERNPFADYSMVFVPYCTGDVHLGNAVTEYTSDLTVHHKGYVNGTAALDHLADTFPDAEEIVVIGASAGSVSAPLYAGMVADRFPDAEITSIADSSGAYPDAPEFNDDILTASGWGTTDALSTVTSDLRSMPELYISAAQRHPDITFARFDHAYDEVQAYFVLLAAASADDLLALIDANETQIEEAGVNLLSYTAPGDQHVVLDDDAFFDETVGATALVDWVADVVEGSPVEDVHCTDCTAG